MPPACTTWQRCYGLDRSTSVSPAFIKIGGIEAVSKAAIWARMHGVDYVPHCFYFGPGFLASLHLAAAFAPEVAFDLFFGDLQASPYHDAVRARQGRLSVPRGPGWDSTRTWRYSIATASAPPVVIELTVCFHSGRPTVLGREFAGDVSFGAICSRELACALTPAVDLKGIGVRISAQQRKLKNL
jgi:hypothetical protein